jgi:hypothetical protein
MFGIWRYVLGGIPPSLAFEPPAIAISDSYQVEASDYVGEKAVQARFAGKIPDMSLDDKVAAMDGNIEIQMSVPLGETKRKSLQLSSIWNKMLLLKSTIPVACVVGVLLGLMFVMISGFAWRAYWIAIASCLSATYLIVAKRERQFWEETQNWNNILSDIQNLRRDLPHRHLDDVRENLSKLCSVSERKILWTERFTAAINLLHDLPTNPQERRMEIEQIMESEILSLQNVEFFISDYVPELKDACLQYKALQSRFCTARMVYLNEVDGSSIQIRIELRLEFEASVLAMSAELTALFVRVDDIAFEK